MPSQYQTTLWANRLMEHYDTGIAAAKALDMSHDGVNKWLRGSARMSKASLAVVKSHIYELEGRQQKTTSTALAGADKKPHGLRLPPPPERTEAYTKSIDWKRWVYDDGEVKGISLRAMVEDGLYEHARDAVAALKRGDFNFAEVTAEMPGRGRNPTDYILPLKHAQLFAAEARTETGREIRRLLILKAEEFDRILNAEPEAVARLADHHDEKNTSQKFLMGLFKVSEVADQAIHDAQKALHATSALDTRLSRLERRPTVDTSPDLPTINLRFDRLTKAYCAEDGRFEHFGDRRFREMNSALKRHVGRKRENWEEHHYRRACNYAHNVWGWDMSSVFAEIYTGVA